MTQTQRKVRVKTRRRKIITGVVVVLLLIGVAGGAYAYRVVNAIVHAEKSAVVPLPTRSGSFAINTIPTATPQTIHQPTVTPQPTVVGTRPTSDAAATQNPINVTAPTDAAIPTATTAASSDPNATATLDPYRPLPSADSPSHLDVINELWGAVGSDDPGTSKVWGGKTDIYLMLLGVDRRPDGGDQNADVILLVHVDLFNGRISAVSIPRDLLVEIPGIGEDKINSAYNYGYKADPTNKVAGAAKMRDTIESVFQVPIDGYILVDFNGFTDVVDEMGGIDINVPSLLIDDDYPTADYGTETVTFLPGPQKMNGERALKYVRTRHQDSDDGRRERQIQVLRALFAKAKSFDSITNGFKIISALGDTVQTGFTLEQQLTLAKLGYEMQDSDIYTASLTGPLITGGYQPSGAWAYTGDATAIRDWVQANLATNPQPTAEGSPTSGTSSEFSGTPEASPSALAPPISSPAQTPTAYVPSVGSPGQSPTAYVPIVSTPTSIDLPTATPGI